MQTHRIHRRIQIWAFSQFCFKYLVEFEAFLPATSQLAGLLLLECLVRGTYHVCFTADLPQSQVDSNPGVFHHFASNIWFNLKLFLLSMRQLGGMLVPKCEFRGTDNLYFTADPPLLN
jgi:hypothetical protein